MAEAAYPYATHLDIKFDPLKLIDVSSLAKTVTDPMVQSNALQGERLRGAPWRNARRIPLAQAR
jgi:hypothetical protein